MINFMPKSPLATARDALKVFLTRYPQVYAHARRPYAATRFALRQPHDSDYGAFALFPGRPGVFLDVGANAGMSALSFRIYNRKTPIVSIEPNPFHEADLRFTGRLARPFAYRMCAAGRDNRTDTLYVPVYRGVPLTTEASLLMSEVVNSGSLRARLGDRMDSPDFVVVERTVMVMPLDDLSLNPAFIKLDVQGAEYEAILGLEQTIRRCKPVMLVEVPDGAVRSFLGSLGYEARTYARRGRSLEPDVGASSNTVFVAD